jgi:outer membrane protein
MRNYFFNIICFILLLSAVSSMTYGADNAILEMHGLTSADTESAAHSGALSLYEVFISALGKNSDLAIERERSIQADSRRSQAIGSYLPRISLRGAKMFPDDGAGSQRTRVSLYARQNIFTGLTEYARLKSSGYELKMRKSLLFYYSGTLLLDSAHGFYSVLQLEKSIKNREETLKLYSGIAAELRRRANLGRTKRSEVLLTEAQIQKLEAEILSLKNDLHRTRLGIATLAGVNINSEFTDTLNLPDPGLDLEKCLTGINNRPEIEAAGYDVKIAEQNLLEAKGGHLPTAYLEGSYSLYSKGNSSRDYNASLGLELPIFSGGITRARVKESGSKLREAELRLDAVKDSAVEDVTDAWKTWESSAGQVEAFRAALSIAERSHTAVMNEYRLNLTGILDVFNSLRELQNARDEYDRRKFQHALNRIRLGVATCEFRGVKAKTLKPVIQPEPTIAE